ncbi:MAG: hypothetical protein K9L23_21935 [Desulfotignum sp.]|nr:hypothetical protein [Desulfotignum sp.]MCF8090707.1 hypothetical protein [Desulfotignum sp.]
MKLPNAEKAIIDERKIKEYCLNPDHPRGKHKAKVFLSLLGITSEKSPELINQIRKKIMGADCLKGDADAYGQRFTVDVEIEIDTKKAVVRTGWILKQNETRPVFTTCYVK